MRRAIGYVPQASGVDREATGRENLLLQGRLQGMRGADLERRADELLEVFGLGDKANALVKTYSGGMKRRLDVATGLVHRPHVLFLDEPTTGLDPEARAAMWEELERLAAAERLTILLTTHYLEEADRLARRVAIVSRGQIVVEGSPEELKRELRGDAVMVELDGADARPRRRGGARARGGARGEARRAPAAPAGRPGRGGRARHPRRAGRGRRRRARGHRLAALARRRLPPPHGPGLPRRRRGRRMKVVTQTLYLCGRVLRNLSRQPIWIVVMVVQPMFWLLLYSQLFRRITELPGFGTTSYIDYLTPGVAVMTAFFSGSWAGMGMIEDLDRGVLERFLATPASRAAIVFGRILEASIVASLQALLILAHGPPARSDERRAGRLGRDPARVVPRRGRLLGSLPRRRAADPAGGVDDRGGAVHRPAAPLLLLASDRAGADPRLDARPLAPQPGRVGRARGARGGAAGHRLERDGNVHRPAGGLRRADDRLRDLELPLLPADAVISGALGTAILAT